MKTYLPVLLLCLGANALAQNEFTKWYFGKYAGLDFMTTPPSNITHTTLNTFEGSASAADAAGNLIFYTDGSTIWNQQQLVMANGTGLLGNGSTVQSALIVKQPGNSTIYYVFTLAAQGAPAGLRYSLVDMSLAAGMGSVTVKNATITTPCTEQLAGTRHCNGVDMWIVTHDYTSANFRSFLLTSAGLNVTPVISNVGSAPPTFTPNNTVTGQGTIKISTNGRKLGLTYFNGAPNIETAVFDFDRSSGVVSNYLSLMTGTVNCYGCEFSEDGTKFYTGVSSNPGPIYQWDLCAGSNAQIMASKTAVASPAYSANQLQLAPNGKIYIVRASTQLLAAIDNPDVAGPGCNYVAAALALTTGTNGFGLPNFIGGAFKIPPSFTYTSDPTSCSTVSFSAPPNPTVNIGCGAADYAVQGLVWNFGEPLSGAANTSTLGNPTHNFGSPGTYTVKLVLNYPCGADTVYKNITVTAPGLIIGPSGTVACAGTSVTLLAQASGSAGTFSYSWTGGPATASYTVTQNTAGTATYSVNVTDQNGCSVTAVKQILFLAAPTLSTQNAVICARESKTLTVSGASNYTWSPGNTQNSTAVVSPTSTQVYTVTGTDTNGCSARSTVTVSVFPCTSLSEMAQAGALLSVYPNPTPYDLVIEARENLEIILYDATGREIMRRQMETGSHTLHTGSLSSGTYFLQASGKSGGSVSKIIRTE